MNWNWDISVGNLITLGVAALGLVAREINLRFDAKQVAEKSKVHDAKHAEHEAADKAQVEKIAAVERAQAEKIAAVERVHSDRVTVLDRTTSDRFNSIDIRFERETVKKVDFEKFEERMDGKLEKITHSINNLKLEMQGAARQAVKKLVSESRKKGEDDE